jgi:hypothetical protein
MRQKVVRVEGPPPAAFFALSKGFASGCLKAGNLMILLQHLEFPYLLPMEIESTGFTADCGFKARPK